LGAVTQTLVDAIRMLTHAEMMDHSGHCSARRDRETFYINSAASVRGTLTIDDIVAIDLDGHLVEGSARPPFEFPIHAEIYRTRPDVNAIMHTHPRWSTFLTMVGVPYRAVFAQGALLGEVPVLDSPLSVNTPALGRTLAGALGTRPAVLLKAHGAAVVGASVTECFALAAYLEENAYRQYMAMQIGDPYVFSESEQRACRERLWTPNLFQKTWDHYRAKLG
jgi:ribulose-5-phosphate 4-epimerase/fuculose-1-phosphate aldolase